MFSATHPSSLGGAKNATDVKTLARSVLTIATAKPAYMRMALTLARSFQHWNKGSDIRFYIATDQEVELPRDLKDVELIRIERGQFGSGFGPKLRLDLIAPTDATLFIDADCLCFGELDSVFDRLRGHNVSVVGGSISQGEWFGDVGRVCAHFGLTSLPKFNGGIYYLERGAKANAVYRRARELEKEYDALGLVRLRQSPNDELLMAIAMGLEGCTALPDDGTILGDPLSCPRIGEIDVIRGVARLSNPPPGNADHSVSYPSRAIQPRVLHFLGDYTSHSSYRAARWTLELARASGLPVSIVSRLIATLYKRPALTWKRVKPLIRPAYHRAFGVRRVKASERV